MPFIELQSVDSTNNYARGQLHAGLAQPGMAIFAHEQIAGKGQRGKLWKTEKGANIILSLVVNPTPLLLTQQFQLSVCVAASVHEFFSKYAGDDTKIKWPNDLCWQDRKAGGILIESVVHSRQAEVRSREPGVGSDVGASAGWTSIVGIGININQTSFDPGIKNPVSLKQITGKNFEPVELSKELCRVFNKWFIEFNQHGFEPVYTYYLSHLYKRNEIVRLKKDNRVFETMIEGVSTAGQLITKQPNTENSMVTAFDFGEVEWVIK
ncbi:MAG: biotin--[acetyl-CoA-carboxylase] ligase [Bacteroidota bacterium]